MEFKDVQGPRAMQLDTKSCVLEAPFQRSDPCERVPWTVSFNASSTAVVHVNTCRRLHRPAPLIFQHRSSLGFEQLLTPSLFLDTSRAQMETRVAMLADNHKVPYLTRLEHRA